MCLDPGRAVEGVDIRRPGADSALLGRSDDRDITGDRDRAAELSERGAVRREKLLVLIKFLKLPKEHFELSCIRFQKAVSQPASRMAH